MGRDLAPRQRLRCTGASQGRRSGGNSRENASPPARTRPRREAGFVEERVRNNLTVHRSARSRETEEGSRYAQEAHYTSTGTANLRPLRLNRRRPMWYALPCVSPVVDLMTTP
jgi:hypothetical protein